MSKINILGVLNALEAKGVEVEAMYGNRFLAEVSLQEKKKRGMVKMATSVEMAKNLLDNYSEIKWIPCLMLLPRAEAQKVIEEADAEESKQK